MNKLSYIFIFVFFTSCTKISQDYTIREITTNVSFRINEIYFLNQQKGFAVGGSIYDEGYILRTLDGGTTWIKLDKSHFFSNRNIPLQTLNSIDFLNDTLGQVVGYGGKILRTYDGGDTWEIIRMGTWENYNDVKLFTENKTLLISVGALGDGAILPTNEKWYFFDRISTEYAIRDLEFIDNNLGFFAGYGTVKKTQNGGNSWTLLDIKGDYFYDLDFINAEIGYVCGWDGSIYKTTNSGETWKNVHPTNLILSKRYHFENIDFITEQLGAVCSYDGEILITKNGGETWEIIPTEIQTDFHSIYFLNENTIFAGGENGVFIEVKI